MGKMGQKAKCRKIGKNGQKMMNRNEKSPNFLFGINASILQPPHYVRKKIHGVQQVVINKFEVFLDVAKI